MVVQINIDVTHHYNLYKCHSVIIDCGISTPRQGKDLVDGLNAIDKGYIYQLM